MRERPILFSAPMVRAILAGTKTQTRRVVRAKAPRDATHAGVIYSGSPDNGTWWWCNGDPKDIDTVGATGDAFRCPYGVPGDQLWVRETFSRENFGNAFLATATPEAPKIRWTPAIHMPRAASRISLEIAGVRIERLQAISVQDAYDEGVQLPVSEERRPLLRLTGPHAPSLYVKDWKKATVGDIVRAEYASLWDGLNAKRGFGWFENPWVWVVQFRRAA